MEAEAESSDEEGRGGAAQGGRGSGAAGGTVGGTRQEISYLGLDTHNLILGCVRTSDS